MKVPALIGLMVAGIIHLLPVPGVLGNEWLKSLYGINAESPDLAILLQHRALLFGIIGILLFAAVPLAHLRAAAIFAALASMASFIAVAVIVGNYGPAIRRVVLADIVGIVALLPALWSLRRQAVP